MALTGVPLIALTLLATAAAIAATTLFWGRFGRWRPVSRTAGLLLCEALVVLSAGLIANRHEEFYPSWQALSGTGTTTTTAVQPAGRLDAAFGPATTTVVWRPPGSAAWRLASNAELTIPHGYLGSLGSFPVLLALGGRPASGDLVRVTAMPTPAEPTPGGPKATPGAVSTRGGKPKANPGTVSTRGGKPKANPGTAAAALADLPRLLGADLRVTGHGWALVSSSAFASLAERLIEDDPGRFAALAVVGAPPPGFRYPPGVAVAVARTAPAHSVLPRGVTALTGAWAAASGWAITRTALPLAAPEVLPTGAA